MTQAYIKSPLNYIGGKYKILPQIFPLFPKENDKFVDLFAGGANVGINSMANTIILNDNLTFLMDLYETMKQTSIDEVLAYIDATITKFDLNLTNTAGYQKLRDEYNTAHNPLDLLILSCFSFNHQIRFNNNKKFNTPFGKNRSRYNKNIEKNLVDFVNALHNKNVFFTKKNFDEFDFTSLTKNDFVYCDPPYLITVGTYNDGKRGFTGWGLKEEKKLLDILDNLDSSGVNFALSNVLRHKDKKNDLLRDWVTDRKYQIHKVDNNFANSNYHTSNRDKNSTHEVLITNY